MSRASGRRLRRWFALLRRDAVEDALFVTLTMPGLWWPGPEDAKRLLRAWFKRLRRRYPGAALCWVLELQDRGAPHFHLCLFGVAHLPAGWLSASWFDVVWRWGKRQGLARDDNHLRAGTQVQRVRSYAGAVGYMGKYISKGAGALSAVKLGRCWGRLGDLGPFLAPLVNVRMASGQWARLARCLDAARLAGARLVREDRRARAVAQARRARQRDRRHCRGFWFCRPEVYVSRLVELVGEVEVLGGALCET